MEIMKASSGAYYNLHLLQPPPHHHHHLRASLHFTKHSPRNTTKLLKWNNSLTTTNALPHDSASGGSIATEVPVLDLALEVKKKASELGPELKGTSIFLVGMNSSLKSSVGKLIADGLRYYYFDSDALVEEALGGRLAAKSLLQTDDDKAFRDSETEVLKQLSSMGRMVVSAGNGAVQCATNLALLRHGISIWIDVPLDMVAREVVDHTIQLPAPEMSISGSYSEVVNQLTALYQDRHSGYATADTTISLLKVASELGYDDLDAVTSEDMALEVLKALERLVRVKKMMAEASRPF